MSLAIQPINPYCSLPSGNRNYILADKKKTDYFVKQKENALPYLSDVLIHSNNEAQITETLYILDKMIDNGTKGIDKMYPVLARFNNTPSANIQTFLAGIYRKTQIPDAFGPLVKIGPCKSLLVVNILSKASILCPSIGPKYLNPKFSNIS